MFHQTDSLGMNPGEPPPISESDAITHVNDAYERMLRNARQAGREVPRVAIYPERVGEAIASNSPASDAVDAYRDGIEIAKMSIAASEAGVHKSNRRSFLVPDLPWQRDGRVRDLAERLRVLSDTGVHSGEGGLNAE